MKRMKPTFNFFFFITAVSALMAASCDKNNHDVPKGELPDPIRIELRAAEQEMIGADQAFAFEFFENVYLEEAKDDDANFMVSPLSLSMALAMTSNGAMGLLQEASVNIVILRADWGWEESDKQLFTRLQELSGTTPVLICLNRSRKEVVEGFTGMLPPYSAWRSFLFRFTQFGFTASHK